MIRQVVRASWRLAEDRWTLAQVEWALPQREQVGRQEVEETCRLLAAAQRLARAGRGLVAQQHAGEQFDGASRPTALTLGSMPAAFVRMPSPSAKTSKLPAWETSRTALLSLVTETGLWGSANCKKPEVLAPCRSTFRVAKVRWWPCCASTML